MAGVLSALHSASLSFTSLVRQGFALAGFVFFMIFSENQRVKKKRNRAKPCSADADVMMSFDIITAIHAEFDGFAVRSLATLNESTSGFNQHHLATFGQLRCPIQVNDKC